MIPLHRDILTEARRAFHNPYLKWKDIISYTSSREAVLVEADQTTVRLSGCGVTVIIHRCDDKRP